MLAAAVPARDGDSVLEAGAGAGVASLCLALRVSGCCVLGIDIVPALVALAQSNAQRNGLERRVAFRQADVFDLPKMLRRGFDHVMMNPPFHGPDGVPARGERARALHDSGLLALWLQAAWKRVSAGGTLTVILRADRLDEALQELPAKGTRVFPLWARAGEAAKRVILQLRKNARAPFELLPGMTLHDESGAYTAAAEDVLRGRASLALATPRR